MMTLEETVRITSEETIPDSKMMKIPQLEIMELILDFAIGHHRRHYHLFGHSMKTLNNKKKTES